MPFQPDILKNLQAQLHMTKVMTKQEKKKGTQYC